MTRSEVHPRSPGDCVGELIAWVRSRGDCVVEAGLSDAELTAAETEFQVTLPMVWRQVLAEVHPVSLPIPPRDDDGILRWMPYPDWRQRDAGATRQLIDRPIEGVVFDVEHNSFWWRAWGQRPEPMNERVAVARQRLATAPRLVPIRGHWYVGPAADSPVLSIVQTDLWSPAVTLCDLVTERSEAEVSIDDYPLGSVPFWSELHAWSQIGHTSPFGQLAE